MRSVHRTRSGYEVLDLPADPGQAVAVYSAEAGSASEEALRELDRWSATRARLAVGRPGERA